MGRTNSRFIRTYLDGYDLSGYSRSIGTVGYAFDNSPDAAYSDNVKNIVNGQAAVQVDPLNAFLAPSATVGFHELMAAGSGLHTYTIAYGIRAEPTQGDIIFSMPMEQASYQAEDTAVNVSWGGPTSTNTMISLGYASPFGYLLHGNVAATGANTAVGIDDYGATPPELGGYFSYHLLSSNGTVTLTAQEADTNSNGSFGPITGATSGSITAAVAPKHGMVAIAKTYAVKRYLRWQLAFGDATTATFVMGFHRRLWI
jgi:hypothetical protein